MWYDCEKVILIDSMHAVCNCLQEKIHVCACFDWVSIFDLNNRRIQLCKVYEVELQNKVWLRLLRNIKLFSKRKQRDCLVICKSTLECIDNKWSVNVVTHLFGLFNKFKTVKLSNIHCISIKWILSLGFD